METKKAQILITGANRGIGRAFAKAVAADKAHLHLVIRKKDPELEAEMMAAGAASCQIWLADLSERKSVEKLISDTADLKIDVLFNNAGLLFDLCSVRHPDEPAKSPKGQINKTSRMQ